MSKLQHTQFKTEAELGLIIREHRKNHLKMRIDDAAALCRVSVSLLSALENGSRPVGLDKALMVALTLGIELFARSKE